MSRQSKSTACILNVVEMAAKPISSQDIHQKLLEIDRATIYRTLNKLKERQLIRVVELGDGIVRYESFGDHHHHLICLKCKKIEKVHLPPVEESRLQKIQKRFEKQSKFISLQHSLEFFGICQKCQNLKKNLK